MSFSCKIPLKLPPHTLFFLLNCFMILLLTIHITLNTPTKNLQLFLIVAFCLLLSFMIILYLVPESLQNPFKQIYSFLFAIGFLEMSDFKNHSISQYFWAFSLYLVVNQEICEKNSGFFSLHLICLFYLFRRIHQGN